MSQATKRRIVEREVMNEEPRLPLPNEQIVRIRASMGNYLFEVEAPKQEVFLVSMPSRFRKSVWVKRGDFMLVQPIEEGDKVRAEMVRPIPPDYVRYLRKNKAWPAEFEKILDLEEGNPNRPHLVRPTRRASSSSDSTSSSSDAEL